MRRRKPVKPRKLDTEEMLRLLTIMRRSLPLVDRMEPPRPSEDGRVAPLPGMRVETEEDMEWAAVHAAVTSLLADLEAIGEQKHAKLMEQLLAVYHATKEASRDPEYAYLIPYVEQMEEAYERAYGKKIPEKGKG